MVERFVLFSSVSLSISTPPITITGPHKALKDSIVFFPKDVALTCTTENLRLVCGFKVQKRAWVFLKIPFPLL